METLKTPITQLFGIKHPIILAGMNVAAGPSLAAAVCNAGGLGVVGGVGHITELLQEMIDDLKEGLLEENAPFGVDLLLPKIGGGARATNYDYTKGELPAPRRHHQLGRGSSCARRQAADVTVERLHKAGIVVQNMIGSPGTWRGARRRRRDLRAGRRGRRLHGRGGDEHPHPRRRRPVPGGARRSPAVRCLSSRRAASPTAAARGGARARRVGGVGGHAVRRVRRGRRAGHAWRRWSRRGTTTRSGRRLLGTADAHQEECVRRDASRTQRPAHRPRIVRSPRSSAARRYVMNWEEERGEEMRSALKKGKLPHTSTRSAAAGRLSSARARRRGSWGRSPAPCMRSSPPRRSSTRWSETRSYRARQRRLVAKL